MDQSRTITIGAGAIVTAPVTIADSIEGSFNALSAGHADNDVKCLVEQILQQIVETSKVAPPQVAKDLAENAELLSKEVVRAAPRREWYELSMKGLEEAALAVGELGVPIINATGKLLPLLQKLWP